MVFLNFLFLQILSAKVLTTNYTLNSAKLIVLRENFKTLQHINTTLEEPKRERGCSSRQLACVAGTWEQRAQETACPAREIGVSLSRARSRLLRRRKTAVLTTIPCARCGRQMRKMRDRSSAICFSCLSVWLVYIFFLRYRHKNKKMTRNIMFYPVLIQKQQELLYCRPTRGWF